MLKGIRRSPDTTIAPTTCLTTTKGQYLYDLATPSTQWVSDPSTQPSLSHAIPVVASISGLGRTKADSFLTKANSFAFARFLAIDFLKPPPVHKGGARYIDQERVDIQE